MVDDAGRVREAVRDLMLGIPPKDFDIATDALGGSFTGDLSTTAATTTTYGATTVFKEERQYEGPLNVYGFSKLVFDQHVRRVDGGDRARVVGGQTDSRRSRRRR